MKRAFAIAHPRPQRGAATLVVVMVLFLVMALLAAYANRSLMFEQRIAGSYYRASMAQEMAEGATEWTLAMLNGTAINNSCTPIATGGTRFVDLYLNVSPDDRATTSQITTPLPSLAVDCSSTGTGLTCRCPQPNTRAVQPPTPLAGALIPSFGVAVGTDPTLHYGSFEVTTYGCTDSSVDNCASTDAEARSQTAAAMAVHKTSIGFIGAVPSSPAAPLTVRGNLTTSGVGGLGLHNTDPRSGGLLVVSGGPAPALDDSRMDSVPGTPASQASLFNDDYLLNLPNTQAGNDTFFRNFMGVVPSRYPNHPAARQLACGGGDCSANLVNAFNAGMRMLMVPAGMTISNNVTIGTPARPVLVVVSGPVTITGPMQLNGMLVVLGDLGWTNTGPAASQINGMLVVQGAMHTVGRMDVVYQQSIANELRNRLGSYARVPGGWKDYDTK